MTTVTTLTRRFQIGATLLDDPAPNLPPEDAVRLFLPNYPMLATARLGEPKVTADVITYPVEKPQVQVKGAVSELDAAEAALRSWAQAPAPQPKTAALWLNVGERVGDVLRRDPTPMIDAFSIPLA